MGDDVPTPKWYPIGFDPQPYGHAALHKLVTLGPAHWRSAAPPSVPGKMALGSSGFPPGIPRTHFSGVVPPKPAQNSRRKKTSHPKVLKASQKPLSQAHT